MFQTGFPKPRGNDVSGVGWRMLADFTLGNDLAANSMITFSELSGFRAIQIIFAARSSAATGSDISVRFNSDNTAKYARKVMNNSTMGADTVSQTAISLVNANSASANVHATGYIDILNETNKVKTLFGFHAANSPGAGTAPSMIFTDGVYYETVNPINDINIFAATNPIQAGSRFTVYGLK